MVFNSFLANLWSFFSSQLSVRTRAVLLVTLLLIVIFVITLVPQVSVLACMGSGSCPCPGC
jgi:hypothetical protein